MARCLRVSRHDYLCGTVIVKVRLLWACVSTRLCHGLVVIVCGMEARQWVLRELGLQ
jgi:hypothetical protein